MAVTREQFDAGMTYDAYKAQMTRNKEQFEQNEKDLQLSADDVAAFKNLPRPVNVLALAEDWCGDVVANLPILGRLEKEAGGKLNVRVLLRDQQPGEKVMDEHLNKGQFKSIPTLIFLDANFNEVGTWIERPDSVTKLREEKRRAQYAAHPEWGDPSKPIAELPEEVRTQVQQGAAAIRTETKPFSNSEVVREIRAVAQKAVAKQPA
ncbi:MAG: thioredoxin family protein [Chloroflexi bacterium]|nr:thioredoxin family protein [Chloroflexota bacterium]MBV9595752.1 thioredoxin family protein [Chloroflexota bacterium]